MVSVLLRHKVKGLTNKLYTYALARKKTGLHAKFQVHRCFEHGFGLHCNVLSGHKRKGLTNKLCTYAPVWKKTGLHAKFQVHMCFDMDLVCIVMYCQDTKERG